MALYSTQYFVYKLTRVGKFESLYVWYIMNNYAEPSKCF